MPEVALSLAEFIDLDSRPVLDPETVSTAMPAITGGPERAKG